MKMRAFRKFSLVSNKKTKVKSDMPSVSFGNTGKAKNTNLIPSCICDSSSWFENTCECESQIPLNSNQQHIRFGELTRKHVNNVCVVVLLQCQNPHLKSISNITQSKNPSSITVDYLINSCGLPPETALSASKKIKLSSKEKPYSVLTFFQNHGFTKTQITQLISKCPRLLLYDPIKNYEPKIEFLRDLGVSGPSLTKALICDPGFLNRSLKNQIIPAFNFLKTFIGTNDNVAAAFKRSTWILQYNLNILGTNITILRDHGVPECNISKMFISQPRSLMMKIEEFKGNVEVVKEMGFDPSRPMFVHVVRVLNGLSKSNWERKLMIFQSLGWSETEILPMFKRQPFCFLKSEKKIRKGVGFFMEKLKWKHADISLRPNVLTHSLEKKIVPRCAVLEILDSKGMIRKKLMVTTILNFTEKEFLDQFVIKYHETIPEVVKAYKGAIEFTGFGERRMGWGQGGVER